LIFLCGAVGYGLLEILWRGYTHVSMLFAGGAAFVFVYTMTVSNIGMPLIWRCFWGMLFITAIEFMIGLVVNVWLGLEVWDYSAVRGNLWGQICPVYSGLWFLLCMPLSYLSIWLHSIL